MPNHGLLFSLILLLLLHSAPSSSSAIRGEKGWQKQHVQAGVPTVKIENGTIQGTHSTSYNQDYFLGVPYAQPPVGNLRFRVAQSLNASFDGVRAAEQYSPSCVGYGSDNIGYSQSEDCLYANVVRPANCKHKRLPVAVWIHGGGLVMGGSQDLRYNLSFIVDNSVKIGKPIIGVSINYRLSGWGFLSSQEVTDSGNTNLGLRDQRLALHWIQENIAAFGGDPTKVTIWGESAGAASVGWHLTAYNGRDDGLFRAAIMQSGNPIAYTSYRVEADYQPNYDSLVSSAGCGNATDTLDCLRNAPYNSINDFFNTTTGSGWNPIVDGDIIERWGSQQLNDGSFVHVPIIDGANTDEGTAFGPQGINTDDDFAAYASSTTTMSYLPQSEAGEVLAVYPSDNAEYRIPSDSVIGNFTYPPTFGTQFRRTAAYAGDLAMIANRRATCRVWARNDLPAYCYRFNTIATSVVFYLGATHFQEVAFVFDNTNGYGYDAAHSSVNPFLDKPQSYFDLAFLMSASWASFVYDLDPNGWQGRRSDTPLWSAYDAANPQEIVWDANITALAYNNADTYRHTGIEWIIDHASSYKR